MSNIDFTASAWIDECQDLITRFYTLYDKFKATIDNTNNANGKRIVEQFKADFESLKLEIHKPFISNKRDISEDYGTDLTIDEQFNSKKGHKEVKNNLEKYSPFIASNLPKNFNLQGILKNYIETLSNLVNSDIYDKLDTTTQNNIKDLANYLSQFSKSALISAYKSAKDAYMGVRTKIHYIIQALENYAKNDRTYKYRILKYADYLKQNSKEIGDIIHWAIEYNINNESTLTQIKNNFVMSKPWSWRYINRTLDKEFNNTINIDAD